MITMKKIIFIKSPTPVFNLAYFDGDIIEVHENQADVLIDAGVAKEYLPVFADVEDLPVDIPGRDKLIAAGVTTLEELKEYNDFTEIDGIGVKAGKAIENYLNK